MLLKNFSIKTYCYQFKVTKPFSITKFSAFGQYFFSKHFLQSVTRFLKIFSGIFVLQIQIVQQAH